MSPEQRVTLQFGFNRRASVIGKESKGYDLKGGSGLVTYDDAYIEERARMIQWAIVNIIRRARVATAWDSFFGDVAKGRGGNIQEPVAHPALSFFARCLGICWALTSTVRTSARGQLHH